MEALEEPAKSTGPCAGHSQLLESLLSNSTCNSEPLLLGPSLEPLEKVGKVAAPTTQ